jgi:Domain of unknown function (DUF4278)
MRLSYRGILYDRRPSSQGSSYLCPQVRESRALTDRRYRGTTCYIDPQTKATQVPAKLVGHKLIYRGITYYKLIYQGSTFSVNRNI